MSKKYPAAKTVKFILCEDVREEARQKLSFLGVFPADSITLLSPKPPESGRGVALLQSVALVAILRGAEGEFEAAIRIFAPDGKVALENKLGTAAIPKVGSAVLVWKVQGFVVPAFGRYRAEFVLDERVYPFEFDIVDGGAKPAEQAA